jgi:hypothetical protein
MQLTYTISKPARVGELLWEKGVQVDFVKIVFQTSNYKKIITFEKKIKSKSFALGPLGSSLGTEPHGALRQLRGFYGQVLA